MFNSITSLPGRFDYELHPCNSPFGPAKLFKFVPDKFSRVPAQQNSICRPWQIAPLLAILGKLKEGSRSKSKTFDLPGFVF